MAAGTRFVMTVSMDVAPEKEALFNEVYDEEHIPALMAVPGVLGVMRTRSLAFTMSIGGTRKESPAAIPRYTAIYELTSPDIVASEAWAAAVEAGRWPSEVRPFTTNRRHSMAEVIVALPAE